MVIDGVKPFQGLFTVYCTVLELPFKCSAQRNHKPLSVEIFHRFLNKVVTIAASDRDTLDFFVEAGVSASYA